MSSRTVRAITAHYLPMEWGVKVQGEKIVAWVHLVRTDDSPTYALFYGDDADCYEEFEREGFTISKEVASFAEADGWLKKEVLVGE